MTDEDTKNLVWVPDKDEVFCKATVISQEGDKVRVKVHKRGQNFELELDKKVVGSCNPAKFDRCDDMAELTHLNEPSVIHNLHLRYCDDSIYTYSGLFLVAINPYKKLDIYGADQLHRFHKASFEGRMPPHIFSIAENSYRNMKSNGKNQSILVTGESGAGKTENTKKVIQYLSLISTEDSSVQAVDNIHDKILKANPILESFGNAKTIKNNNSSRFGKFIKIFFDKKGLISGATIDYYLLEKSRVLHQQAKERNYHIFYQLLKGESTTKLRDVYRLDSNTDTFKYLNGSTPDIVNVDDAEEFKILKESFDIMGFSNSEIELVFLGIAVVLLLGNLEFTSWKADQASFKKDKKLSMIAEMLGLDEEQLSKNLLKPRVKAGREYVERLQNAREVKSTIDAISKYLYEKLFQFIIKRINQSLVGSSRSFEQSYIGVLDIAGFEIFDINSFEQLCINYTNEKLQQFFNHHSFILEQSEYLREDIQWDFIDFGLDLQPTIDLIEARKPMGIFEHLNEHCIMPKSSDVAFVEKLIEDFSKEKHPQFKPNKLRSGFVINHYAGPVEYNTTDWLSKNKDPVSEQILGMFPSSTNTFIRNLVKEENSPTNSKLKMVTQKHKEQLSVLMKQLSSTEPHFVRCILPNLEKTPSFIDKELVLNQLRCNGVLEGIRITRAGYPNKMTFDEFYQRYLILDLSDVFSRNTRSNCEIILRHIQLDTELFKIGITKIFFKSGILGFLEEQRDAAVRVVITKLQSVLRGRILRANTSREILKVKSSQVVARNMQKLDRLVTQRESPWLSLFIHLKPLLEDSVKVLDSKEMNESLKQINLKLKEAENAKLAFESENISLKDRLAALEEEIIKKSSSMKENTEALRTLQREEASKAAKLEQTLLQLKQVREVSETLSKDKSEMLLKLTESERSLQSGRDKISQLQEEIDSKAKDSMRLSEEARKAKEVVQLLAQTKALLEQKETEVFALSAKSSSNAREMEQKLADSKKMKQQVSDHATRIDELKSELLEKSKQLDKLTQKMASNQATIHSLETKLQQVSAELDEKSKMYVSSENTINELNKKIAESDTLAQKLLEEGKVNASLLAEINTLKEKHNSEIEQHKATAEVLERLKVESADLLRTKSDYSGKIITLQEDVASLQAKLQDKENLPPKYDPSLMNDYVAIKNKLNEQTAILRNEKFENQKLSEEVNMLRSKVDANFESPSKRSEARRSLAGGDDMRISQMNESRLREDLKKLQIQLKLEESNATRAENYAIELQKKLNQIRATRGINSYSDYEVLYKKSEKRVHELESKIGSMMSSDTNISTGTLSRSNSYNAIGANGSMDFAKIYNDINHTLKSTREELTKSKSEILRLKSLLRESEDELYNIKRENMKSSVKDYEELLARLKVDNSMLNNRLMELDKEVSKYKQRSDEYFEKLELAESAVIISKKHEQRAVQEREEMNNKLKLINEEIRASQKIIKELRAAVDEGEIKLKEKAKLVKSLEDKIDKHEKKIRYLDENYGDKKKNLESYKEEILNLNADMKFKLEKEIEIIKENKRLTIENEELSRIKMEVMAENEEVTSENEAYERQNELQKNEISALKGEKTVYERKLAQNAKQMQSLRVIIEESGRNLEEMSIKNRDLETIKENLTADLSELKDKFDRELKRTQILKEHNNNLEQEKEEVRSELRDVKQSYENSDQRFKDARTDNLVIVQENERVKTINGELKKRVEHLETKLYSNEQLKFLEENMSRMGEEIDSLKSDISDGALREEKLKKQLMSMKFDNESKASQLKKYNDENFNFQNMISQYKSKMEFLYQDSNEKDLKIKSQERELSQLREQVLLLKR